MPRETWRSPPPPWRLPRGWDNLGTSGLSQRPCEFRGAGAQCRVPGRWGPSTSASVSPGGSEETHTHISSPAGGVLRLQLRAPGHGFNRNPPRPLPGPGGQGTPEVQLGQPEAGKPRWAQDFGQRGGPAGSREWSCDSRQDRPARAGPLCLSLASFVFGKFPPSSWAGEGRRGSPGAFPVRWHSRPLLHPAWGND